MCFKFTVLLLRMLRGYVAHHRRVVVEGSAAAPLQTHTAILPGGKFNVVLLRLVMQDATRAVFNVRPEVRIKIYVDDKKVAHANKKGRRSN